MPDQQQQINYGAAPNDGQGDPLRDAFIKTDDNFDAIWAAGPVGSNVTILNNTVAVVNANGNLVLQPNGVGIIQANASLVPNTANIRDLGAADRRWRRIFVQVLNSVDFEVDGDLTVSGNLTIQGDTIQIGNLVTDAKTLQLSNTAANAAQAAGSGITVGATDDIATLLYDSGNNTWDTNIGITASGNVTADYFIGDGSQLTGVYGNSNAVSLLSDLGSNNITTTGNITADYFFGNAATMAGLPAAYFDSNVTALLSSGNVVTDITTSANVSAAYILGNGSQLTGLPEQYGNANVTTFLAEFGSNTIVTTGNIEAGKLDIQNGIGNAWTIYGERILAPSGGEWRSENSSGDDFITSANDGYINLQSLYADGNIASEIKLEHGVARIVVADAPFAEWTFNSTGQLDVPGNIVPDANGVYSLGSESLQWANLWVANNTIYLGGVPVGIGAGNVLTVNGEPVLSNDSDSTITTTGNITADYFFGNGSQLTGLNTSGISNGTSNVDIPVSDGNVTVSANTSTWIFDTNGDLTVPNYINFAGSTFIGDEPGGGSPAFRIVAPLTYGASIETDSDISGNNWTWTFGADGNLTLPTNGVVIVDGGDGVIGPVSDDFVISWDNEEIRLVSVQGSIEMQADSAFRVQTNYDGGTDTYLSRWEFSQDEIVNITGPSAIVTEAGNLLLSGGRDGINSGNTIIRSVDTGVSVYDWTFDNSGNLTAPGNITTTGNVEGDVGFFNDVIVNNAGTNALLYTNSNREIYDTGFAYDSGNDMISGSGNITTTGNISAGYFIGDGSQLTGLPASYGNSDVANFMAAFGSNSISTTGNVTANNISGNILVTGNVTGTTPNVTLIAGSYSWTFDNTGNSAFANGTATVTNLSATGNITGNTAGFAIGYRDIPQISFTGNATLAATDAGKHYYSTLSTGNTLTIANNTSVSWSVGTAITVVNRGTGNITVAQGTGVSLYLAGNSTAGNRTVTTYGMATLLNVAANVWMINGTGVS